MLGTVGPENRDGHGKQRDACDGGKWPPGEP